MGVEYGKVTLPDRDRTLVRAAHGFDPEALGLDWSVTDPPLCQKIIAGREIVEIGEVNDIDSARQSPFLRTLGARS